MVYILSKSNSCSHPQMTTSVGRNQISSEGGQRSMMLLLRQKVNARVTKPEDDGSRSRRVEKKRGESRLPFPTVPSLAIHPEDGGVEQSRDGPSFGRPDHHVQPRGLQLRHQSGPERPGSLSGAPPGASGAPSGGENHLPAGHVRRHHHPAAAPSATRGYPVTKLSRTSCIKLSRATWLPTATR